MTLLPHRHAGDQGTDGDRDLECKSDDLPADQQVLESFVQLLTMPLYTRSIWEGLVTSIGGMSVSVVSLPLLFRPSHDTILLITSEIHNLFSSITLFAHTSLLPLL